MAVEIIVYIATLFLSRLINHIMVSTRGRGHLIKLFSRNSTPFERYAPWDILLTRMAGDIKDYSTVNRGMVDGGSLARKHTSAEREYLIIQHVREYFSDLLNAIFLLNETTWLKGFVGLSTVFVWSKERALFYRWSEQTQLNGMPRTDTNFISS